MTAGTTSRLGDLGREYLAADAAWGRDVSDRELLAEMLTCKDALNRAAWKCSEDAAERMAYRAIAAIEDLVGTTLLMLDETSPEGLHGDIVWRQMELTAALWAIVLDGAEAGTPVPWLEDW